MSSLKASLLEFNPTTIEEVRKEYGLDKPGMMEQAIDILHEWIQKQEHFVKKDFCREYLERVIISTKGSLERAKARVDKMCTLRTRVPELFVKINVKQDLSHLSQSYINVYMPKLTEDNYRVYVVQMKSNITTAILLDTFRHNMILAEYLKRKDYANGIICVADVRENNILDLVAQFNIVDLSNVSVMYTEGFGFRVKKVLILSSSKVIDLFAALLKRVVSAKIGERIEAINTVEDLHKHLPTELLPEDYGGQQKSLIELYDQWTEELGSDENIEYVKEMTQARVNEEFRRSDGCGDEYLGIPGSFKTLNVD
ncbi:uncharacterized protein LOC134800230 [Cydia splendana]|uniref:uncharacterized protein LOC134800230 n=1 Tax=Cydia splendana TaxID=1100963 RepID=UPI00300C330A